MRLALKAILATLLLVCLGAGAAWAETKIGVVDVQRALNESEAGKKAKESLNKRVEKMQTDLKAKKDALDKIEADFKKQSAVLSGDAKRDKEKEFDRKKRDFADTVRDYQEEINQAELTATQPIVKDLEQLIEKLGKDQGYTVILEQKMSGAIYTTKGVDITEQIIKTYNESKAKK